MRGSSSTLFRAVHKASTRRSRAFGHLASLDANSLYLQRRWRKDMGAVGYADRSASCVSPPLCPFAFIALGAYSGGAKAVFASFMP